MLWGLVVVFSRSWAVVSEDVVAVVFRGVRAVVFFEGLSLKSGQGGCLFNG